MKQPLDSLDDEIRHHLECDIDENIARGMTPDAARTAAFRKFGNVAIVREDARAVWIPVIVDQLTQDVRFALRSMRRQPGFTAAVVSMLALGLGLMAGGYTVVNGLFVRGWDVPDSERVFRVRAERPTTPGGGIADDGITHGAYAAIRQHARGADYVAMAIQYFRVRTEAGSGGAHAAGMIVSANAVEALQIPLQSGSGFGGAASREPRVVISDGLWRRMFASDPAIVGRTAWIGGVPATIVGVTARGFEGLGERRLDVIAQMATPDPWGQWSADDRSADGTMCCVMLAARVREGWTKRQAQRELMAVVAQYREATGQPPLSISVLTTAPGESVRGGRDGGTVVLALALIGAGVVLVLLLTCANVGNLFLARSLRREREIAMRLSLGASRARVVRQLLTEGLVMAMAAGTAAFLLTLGVPRLMPLLEDGAPTTMFEPDWRVAGFTVAGVLATCLLVSLAPALQTTRVAWRGATAAMSPRTGRIRSLVLAVQIAIAAVLVISAMLLTRGIERAVGAPVDFALHTTTAITLQAPANRPYTSQQFAQLRDALARAIQSSRAPFGIAGAVPAGPRAGFVTSVRLPGSDVRFRCQLVPLTADAAGVLNLRLESGRWAADDLSAHEIVLNATLARQMWPGESALGRSVTLGFTDRTYNVVGVVRDAHLTSLSGVDPMVHVPLTNGMPVLLARTERGLDQRVRTLVASIDPGLTATLIPLSTSVRHTLRNASIGAQIAGGLGVVALALAIIGVIGVFSYLVEERRREIGIRIAMGASRAQVAGALAKATRWAMCGGALAGVALSIAAGRTLRRFLFGLSPLDPLTYLSVAAVLGLAAVVATAIPVRRAMRVDPAVTLRAE